MKKSKHRNKNHHSARKSIFSNNIQTSNPTFYRFHIASFPFGQNGGRPAHKLGRLGPCSSVGSTNRTLYSWHAIWRTAQNQEFANHNPYTFDTTKNKQRKIVKSMLVIFLFFKNPKCIFYISR